MGCNDSHWTDAEVKGYEKGQRMQKQKQAERLKIATKLACRYCRSLEKRGKKIPDFAVMWWKSHKANDEARKNLRLLEQQEAERHGQQERIRSKALDKLTVAEARALGFKLEATTKSVKRMKCRQCQNPMLKGIHTCDKEEKRRLPVNAYEAQELERLKKSAANGMRFSKKSKKK